MTSKERILNAIRGKDVDYVPFITIWNENQKLHERLSWTNERERLEFAQKMGWDTFVRVSSIVTPLKELSVTKEIKTVNGAQVLAQTWKTPKVTLYEELNYTDDWDKSEISGAYLGLLSDFRPTRYISVPFKTEKDLEALDYIFPIDNPSDTERLKEHYNQQRKLADEFNYPLFSYMDSGMDWLIWLYHVEEAIYRAVDQPEFIQRILDHINKAKFKRMELLLELGIDGVQRRGWYETTDIWNPELLKKFAWPVLEKEIEATHNAGKVFIYTLDTGIKAIAKDLAAMDIDCMHGLDTLNCDMSIKEIHKAFPGKALWGGLSAAYDFGADTPEQAKKAVEEAISVYGKKHLILGMAASYRYYYPYENYEAAESTWRRLR